MNKIKLLKGAALAIAAGMLPISVMADDAGGTNWSLSGWINQGVTYASDGNSSDITSVADNGNTLGSRMTFAGSTDLPAGLNAGFDVTLELLNSPGRLGFGTDHTGSLESFTDQNGDLLNVLGHSVFVSGGWGKVTFGLQSMPTDNIAVLEDPSLTLWASISPVFRGNGVLLQNSDVSTGSSVGDFLNCYTAQALRGNLGIGIDCNGIYRQGVRYDLPTFVENLGIAVGWANDDVYDVSAKYKAQLGRLKGSIALGYAENNGAAIGDATAVAQGFNAADNFQVQAGLMDPVTGVFGSIAYQNETAELVGAGVGALSDDTNAYWLKIGMKKAWNTLGDTSISFQYGEYSDQFGLTEAAAGVTGSDLERIGVEINQYFGSRLIVYGTWENLSVDVEGTDASRALYNGADDVDLFTLGLTYFY